MGGRGGGCGRGGGPGPFKHMINDFMKQWKGGECKNWTNEQWQQKAQECGQKFKDHFENNQGGNCNWNFNGKQGWKEARAVCQRKPEHVIEIVPGMTEIVEI